MKNTPEKYLGGVDYYKELGRKDALFRKRKRAVPQNFKLAYVNGWYEVKRSINSKYL